MNEVTAKIDQIGRLIQEVREYKAAHPESLTGYYVNNIGSLLNAYREGDLGFDECVTLLANVDQSKRSSDDAICDDIDLIIPLVKELTAYQANVFLILNDGRAGLRFRDAAALNLIKNHRKLIEDRERRRFEPFATAKAIVEAETCPDIRKQEDMSRLDWLEDFIQTGLIEAAFEMDGGVHLTLSKVGYPASAYREKNSLREAIDEAMKGQD